MNTSNLKNKANKFLKSIEINSAKGLFWISYCVFLFAFKPIRIIETKIQNISYKFSKKNSLKNTQYLLNISLSTVFIALFVFKYSYNKISLAILCVTSGVTILLIPIIKYIQIQKPTLYFSLSKVPIMNRYSLHLSARLIDTLKSIEREGGASLLLHNHYYQNPYLEALDYAFNDLNTKVVTRTTHHLGKKKIRDAAENLLKDNGYDVDSKKVGLLSSAFFRAVLCFDLKNMKPSDFDNFHIYKFTITKR